MRDRVGHGRSARAIAGVRLALASCVLVLLAWPAPAAAQGPGAYTASRFDVSVKALSGGDVEVSETIVFEFQSGTFRRVWREIPTDRTGGIDIVHAAMDGSATPRGDGAGRIKVTGNNRIRIEWQFDPVGPSSHTFDLRYRARGVIFRDGDADVLRWRLLPAEHKYTIASSRSTIAAPVAPSGPPLLETRRVGNSARTDLDGAVEITATNIDRNGWIIAESRYPAGRLITTAPDWQLRNDRATALAPRWMIAAAVAFPAAFFLLITMRQGYSRPSIDSAPTAATEPPERLPAALASVLAARGAITGYPSVATLMDLADRGALTIRELPRTLGVRSYELAQVPGKHDLAEHELEALSIAFAGRADEVTMSKARGRLARAGRRFSAAVNRDLDALGYFDAERQSVRQRVIGTAFALLMVGVLTAVAAAALIPRFQGWPFLVPVAIFATGIIGLILAAVMTPLSDQGLLESARWRGFKQHVKSAIKARDGAAPQVKPQWIVYGIALGLAPQWARYLKAHPAEAPPWFQAATGNDSAAFTAFVGSHAVSSGAGGGAGGAAAGGGGSGAG